LEQENIKVVVVEQDRTLLEDLRSRGVPVVYGDASANGVLAAAGIANARLLLITTPDGYQARRILEIARAANASIDVAVRTHILAELEHFEREHVGHVVMAEREVAVSMLEYALRTCRAQAGATRESSAAGRLAEARANSPRFDQ
jgi:CPA2 family monovalent cation:H+ antiporter-2